MKLFDPWPQECQ